MLVLFLGKIFGIRFVVTLAQLYHFYMLAAINPTLIFVAQPLVSLSARWLMLDKSVLRSLKSCRMGFFEFF